MSSKLQHKLDDMVRVANTKPPFKLSQSAEDQEEYEALWDRFKNRISVIDGWYDFKREVLDGVHGEDVRGKWGVLKEMRRVVMNRRCTAKTQRGEKKRLRDLQDELDRTKEELQRVKGELDSLKAKMFPPVLFID